MRALRNKLRSAKGESYVEILVAVLIIAFAVTIVSVMYSSAFTANTTARQKDQAFFDALQKVEQLDPSLQRDGTVTVTDKEVGSDGSEGGDRSVTDAVDAYEDGGVTSFRKKDGGGGA